MAKNNYDKSNKIIPTWLIQLLIILVLLLLIGYFILPQSSKWEALLLNLSVAIIGIIITFSFVDVIINRYESKKWLGLKSKILDKLVEILMSLYNLLYLSFKQMEVWIKIQNDPLNLSFEKIKELEINLRDVTPDIDYINTIKGDDHLIEFYSDGFSNNLKRLNDFFSLYHLRLSYQESPLIIDLQKNLSALKADLEIMKMERFIKKEFKPTNEIMPANNFSNFLQHATQTISKLSKLIMDIDRQKHA